MLFGCCFFLSFFIVNCIECFYVNDEPESKFLYIETIKLHCIVLYCIVLYSSVIIQLCRLVCIAVTQS